MIPQAIPSALSLWLIPAAIAAIGLTALVAAVQIRRRRSNRLQLRLLAGQRRLLGDEIARRCEDLASLNGDGLDTCQREGEAQLGIVHTRLLDRQAHLQNLEDLARMQRHKIAILQRRGEEIAAGRATGEAPPDPETLPREDSLVDRREHLQDRLLAQIQQRGGAPRPPRRRRRR